MEIEKIFKELINHILQGIIIHQNFANYYNFLGLSGYERCHEYYFLKEVLNYRKIQEYYINHYNKIINKSIFELDKIISSIQFFTICEKIDIKNNQAAAKEGLQKWVEWEKITKKFYKKIYNKLIKEDENAAAIFLEENLIKDVSQELKKAEQYLLLKNNFEGE